MTTKKGLSVSDLRERSRIKGLSRKDGRGVDPIAEALHVERQLTAGAIMRRGAAEVSLGEEEIEVKRLQLEMEKKRLEQEASGDGDSAIINMLMADLKEMRGALGEMQERIYTQERQQLFDQLGALQAQVADLQDRQTPSGHLAHTRNDASSEGE